MRSQIAYNGKQNLSLFKGNQIKVPIAKVGQWKHEVYGDVSFTEKDLKQLQKNYKNNSTGFTPYATFGHLDEEHHSTDSARKRGDMKDVVIEGDVAFGIFDVTEKVYESVLDGEYEYASGEFNRNFMDKEGNKVGTTLLRVALTNSPFIPFGDAKIEALSANAEYCPENNLSSVFLLSIDAANKPEESKEETSKEEEPIPLDEGKPVDCSDPVVEDNESLSEAIALKVAEKLKATSNPTEESSSEKQEIKLETTNKNIMSEATKEVVKDTNLENAKKAVLGEDKAPVKEETVVKEEVKEEPAKVEVKEVVKEDTSKYDSLMSKLESLEKTYAEKLEGLQKSSQSVIEELTSKLEEATKKLETQEVVTQQFSASVSKAQEEALIQNLQNNGVQTPVVQKFLAFKNAYNNSDNGIVKFSVGSGEDAKVIEKTVVDSVADMLIAASRQAPIVEQQLGITSGGKVSNFANIIERNRELAKKQNI